MSTTFLRTKVFNEQLVNILFEHIVRILNTCYRVIQKICHP